MMKFFNKRYFNKRTFAIVAFFTLLINYLSVTAYPIVDNFDKDLLQSPWTENFLVNGLTASFVNSIYIFIIGGFLAADIFVVDRITGLKNIIASKISYKKYIFKALLYNMLMVAIFSIVPALTNILLMFTLRTNVPLVYYNTMNFSNSLFLSNIFLENKLLFFGLYFIKIAVVAISISNFVIFINTAFNNRFIGTAVAFIVDSLLGIIVPMFGIGMVYLNSFLNWLSYPDLLTLLIILFFNIASILYFIKYANRRDIIC